LKNFALKETGAILIGCLVVLVLVLGACGSASGVTEIDQYREAAMPVDAFFGAFGSLDEAVLEWRSLVEEEVAACMKAQGFEYAPPASLAAPQEIAAFEMSDREWAEHYGYGVVSAALLVAGKGPGLGPLAQQLSSAVDEEAYAVALMGASNLDDLQQMPLADRGCLGEGVLKRGGQTISAGLGSLESSRSVALQRIRLDPAFQAAEVDWARCMRERGYEFNTQEDAQGSVEAEAQAIGAEFGEEVNADPGWDLALDQHPAFPIAKFDMLREEEVALALTDLGCSETTVQEVLLPLVRDHELEMLEELGTVLREMRDELTSG